MCRSVFLLPALFATLLAACQPGTPEPAQRAVTSATPMAGAVAAEGGCWATDVMPARFETVLETVELAPARLDRQGRVVIPAENITRERRIEVAPAEERLFAVPCPETMDTVFVAALQRALAVRGLHGGAVTGAMDAETRAAVRRFQAPQGLDSAVLSLHAAQQLGLVALPRAAF